jgi:tetratricopeptide (TPR) repeat protein
VSLVARWLSRSSAPKDDLDLTPPEELRARQRKRWLLWVLALAILLVVAGAFAARPLRDYIRGWQSRRAARAAFVLIERQQFDEASAKARDALQLQFSEPQAWHAIARLLSRTNQDTSALEWWKKIEQAGLLTLEDRRDYARSAIAAGELSTAAKQVDLLLAQKGGSTPIDALLAAHLAVRRGDTVGAADDAARVLADKRARPNDVLSAAILILGIAKPDSPPYINAWKQVEDVARDPENPASLDALMFLATRQSQAPARVIPSIAGLSLEPGASGNQQSPSSSPLNGEISLSLGPASDSSKNPKTMSPVEIANALERHPKTRTYYKLVALQLRVQQDPALTDQYVTDAINSFGNGDDETLAALAGWLNSLGRASKTLELLPLDRAMRSRELFLRHIDALEALDRWEEAKETLMSERFPIDPVLQHMYLATARSHLGETTGTTNEWQRALEAAADNPNKLLGLATYAEQNHADDTADAAYARIIKLAPKKRAAYASRLRLAEKAGRTTDAQALAAEIVKLWPDDAAARNESAYLQLLLGASDGAAEAAERQAQVLVAQEPWNWSARATLGLARLRLGKKDEALAVFRDVWATGSEPPGALAVRAAILAENGYTEGARGDARNLGAEYLLPEERALIAPLLGE